MTVSNKSKLKSVRLGHLGERGFLRTLLPRLSKNVGAPFLVAPGDDAVVLKTKSRPVLSIDGLTDGTHFLSRWEKNCKQIAGFPLARGLGWKLMGASLSDLAAMGKTKNRWAMIYLGAPASISLATLHEIQRGVNEAAKKFDCALAGGDTVRANELSLVAAVGGELVGARALQRSGARPGELICIAGTVGDAARGLEVLQNKARRVKEAAAGYFVRRFFEHRPMFDAGAILSDTPAVTSLIDLSDAVKDTVEIVCEASRVGAAINVNKIPVSAPYRINFSIDEQLLLGGEDYALMFTLKPNALRWLRRRLTFSVIGWTRPASKSISYFLNGRESQPRTSFQHFHGRP